MEKRAKENSETRRRERERERVEESEQKRRRRFGLKYAGTAGKIGNIIII